MMRERSVKAKPMQAWDKVTAARQMKRLASVDYMDTIFDDFMEMHGDRYFRDDPAIVGGFAYLDGQPVTVQNDPLAGSVHVLLLPDLHPGSRENLHPHTP